MADYAEIVKALRLCSAVNSSCEECPCNDPADDLCECANKVSIAAADAIENLLTENAALRRMIGNLTSAQAVMVKEFEGKMEELHDSKSELSAAIAGRETVTNRNAFNVPLTLDELRQMDGEPVYSTKKKQWFFIVHHRDSNSIALVDIWDAAYLPQSAMPLYRQKPEED